MACEILECCHFCKTYLGELPKAAEYIRARLCLHDYERCNRYLVYREFGREQVPFGLDPDDATEAERVARCLRDKRVPPA